MRPFFLTCAITWVSLIAVWFMRGAPHGGQPWTSALTLPHVATGCACGGWRCAARSVCPLSVARCTAHACAMHWSDSPIIARVTAYHHRSGVETYRRLHGKEAMAVIRDDNTQLPYDMTAWILTGVSLILLLSLHVLPALLAGLFVYELVHILAPRLQVVRIRQEYGKLVAVAMLVTVVVVGIVFAALGLGAFFHSEAGSVPLLLKKMADILDRWRAVLPTSLSAYLPDDLDDLKDLLVEGLRGHAGALQKLGAEAGRTVAHILIGVGIGALVALHEAHAGETLGPLARSLQERAVRLSEAFRRMVFAQGRIAALNTGLTTLYLVVILPMFGAHLPLIKTMIVVAFFVGLLPVVGNLVSNTIIVVVSLSVSLSVASASLVFLVIIHKLEYFLNAHMVGTQMHARAWELLLAMLVMEAAFGIVGVIAAPIYYAYLKDELASRGLI